MRAFCDREALLTAFGMVSGVISTRSPKPILQNIKLIASIDNRSVLIGTDLDVGIRYQLPGIKVDKPGTVILPTSQMNSILRTGSDVELIIETDGDCLIVQGLHSQFTLPLEDVNLFPDVPDFAAQSYHVINAADLKKLIRRTMFATDVESTRYALGGELFKISVQSDRDGRLLVADGTGMQLQPCCRKQSCSTRRITCYTGKSSQGD